MIAQGRISLLKPWEPGGAGTKTSRVTTPATCCSFSRDPSLAEKHVKRVITFISLRIITFISLRVFVSFGSGSYFSGHVRKKKERKKNPKTLYGGSACQMLHQKRGASPKLVDEHSVTQV